MPRGTLNKTRILDEMRESGIDPYPYEFDVRDSIQDIVANPGDRYYRTAGRVTRLRRMGKLSFVDIENAYGKLQVSFSREELGNERYDQFRRFMSVGDIIEAQGSLYHTRSGELTLNVQDFAVLTKSLYPIPDKWHGLTDPEARYRQRYLDMIANPEVSRAFIDKAKIITAIRKTLDDRGFVEVETPIIQPVYGGASARPFITRVNALNRDMYLQISPELYLKRFVVGGIERVYTITKNFRNEGIDSSHNPEFTMIEVYQAYTDYHGMMKLTEDVISNALKSVSKPDERIDFSRPFRRITMYGSLMEYVGFDVESMTDEQIQGELAIHGLEMDDEYNRGLAITELFDELVRPHLIDPTFIIDHPIETTPLCKPHRSKEGLIERFELFIDEMEIANAYTELNDPIIQRQLFEEQVRRRQLGDQEAHPMDEDFLTAIEVGLPPTGGLGIGIDRLTMLLIGTISIKDVIPFPMMR